VTRAKRRWAVAHVRQRYETFDVVCIRLVTARGALTRRSRGVWTTPEPVPPSAILSVNITALLTGADDAA
jgi:hypothetical protein